MNEIHISQIASELSIAPKQVLAVASLLNEGGTVPFIARYRKEAHGTLDEVFITSIRDRLSQLAELDKRRTTILESIDEQGQLTPDLKNKIEAAQTLTILEDLYLPYRPKRRTRATIAKEKGLEPLAKLIFEQSTFDLSTEACKYINKEAEVETPEDALAGARDIIAEWISENTQARESIRHFFWKAGIFNSRVLKGKEEEAAKFKDYFEWEESVATAPSHRILAMRRGAKEKFLVMRVTAPEETAVKILEKQFIKPENTNPDQLKLAILDSYKRLLSLSIETEIRMETKKLADEEAIKVFAENIRQLLLAAPLGQKAVLALDPGFRTGCKLVCLDKQGKLIYNDTVYPHNSVAKAQEDGLKIRALCDKFAIEAIAIGNGTASRETESFINGLDLPKSILVIMVNESGASIYSASEAAREEFPDYDLTVRGSVSIGRRLMDPLAELVKIDPKSIGVGQYQHDVDQKKLKESLDDTVISCVNNVGVEVNTASKQLLAYVSGLSSSLASKIVEHRNTNGPFPSRDSLLKVSGLGAKSYEQSAGFLRISNAENPLDSSAVHPESYSIVSKMATDLNCSVRDLIQSPDLRNKIELKSYITDAVGLPTLIDIKAELSKPGRDPREKFDMFTFKEGINQISDLEIGMKLPGIVTNVTNFGAFIDIGVHQDGLVHVSQIADKFISNPADIVKVHQKVEATIIDLDIPRKRISLSLKSQATPETSKGKTTVNTKTRSPNKKHHKQAPPKPSRDKGNNFGESLGLQL